MALMLSVTICYFNNTHQNKVHRTYNRQVCRIIRFELKMNNKRNYRLGMCNYLPIMYKVRPDQRRIV